METKTLKELHTLRESDELDFGIKYVDGSDLDDLFIEMEIVSPHNDQKLIYSRVPASMKQKLEDEKKLARTTKYHNWTSDFADFLERISEMSSEVYTKEEVISEWNNKEIGSRYQLIIEDIEESMSGHYECNKEFDLYW